VPCACLISRRSLLDDWERAMGFTLERGDGVSGSLPVHHDAAGLGFGYVVMVRRLDEGQGG
jgi:hypothetical protein